jgi:hypothetical protein
VAALLSAAGADSAAAVAEAEEALTMKVRPRLLPWAACSPPPPAAPVLAARGPF